MVCRNAPSVAVPTPPSPDAGRGAAPTVFPLVVSHIVAGPRVASDQPGSPSTVTNRTPRPLSFWCDASHRVRGGVCHHVGSGTAGSADFIHRVRHDGVSAARSVLWLNCSTHRRERYVCGWNLCIAHDMSESLSDAEACQESKR
jgi:hypothetical protein